MVGKIKSHIVLAALSKNKYAPPGAKKLYNNVLKNKLDHVSYEDGHFERTIRGNTLAMYLELYFTQTPDTIDQIVKHYYCGVDYIYSFIKGYGKSISSANCKYLEGLHKKYILAKYVLSQVTYARLDPSNREFYLEKVSKYISLDDPFISWYFEKHSVVPDHDILHYLVKNMWITDDTILVKPAMLLNEYNK